MDVIINNPSGGAVSAPPTYQGYGPAYGYGPSAYGPGFGHHPSPFVGILFIVGAVLLVRFVLFRGRRGPPWARRLGAQGNATQGNAAQDDQAQAPRWPFWQDRSDGALGIARERFARSEITAEEYEAIRKGLEER